MGERLPPDKGAEGGSLLILCGTTTTLDDPPAMSASIQPASSAMAWATNGINCATPSDAITATSSPTGLGMAAATST